MSHTHVINVSFVVKDCDDVDGGREIIATRFGLGRIDIIFHVFSVIWKNRLYENNSGLLDA